MVQTEICFIDLLQNYTRTDEEGGAVEILAKFAITVAEEIGTAQLNEPDRPSLLSGDSKDYPLNLNKMNKNKNC